MIGRINSTAQIGRLNRVVKRKEAGEAWWLAGGIDPSDCVAAYQAKGAASYAASKVNLANPGTYDLFADSGKDLSWSAATGWTGDGTKYLRLGTIAPNDQSWSVIVCFANGYASHHLFGFGPPKANGRFTITIDYTNDWISYQTGYYTGTTAVQPKIDGGVLAIAGRNCYRNGVLDTTLNADSGSSGEIWVGGRLGRTTDNLKGNLIAIAFYPITLSAVQVAALTIAMNAL